MLGILVPQSVDPDALSLSCHLSLQNYDLKDELNCVNQEIRMSKVFKKTNKWAPNK